MRASQRDEPPLPPPYLVLLHMGFAVPRTVAGRAVRSYRTLSPLPRSLSSEAVCSLLHFPSRRRASPLTSMLLYGVRTFLPRCAEAHESDRVRASGPTKR